MKTVEDTLQEAILKIPHFPDASCPVFYHIGPIIENPALFDLAISSLHAAIDKRLIITRVAAIEARAWLFVRDVARPYRAAVDLIRKVGKTPPPTIRSEEHAREYGTAILEMAAMPTVETRPDGVTIVLDDVTATGATQIAAARMVRNRRNKDGSTPRVVCLSLIELTALKGRERLAEMGVPLFSVIKIP